MPKAKRLGIKPARHPVTNWNAQYKALEQARRNLIARLDRLKAQCGSHRSWRTAQTLLNQQFRRARVSQRAALLASAEWVIRLLENAPQL